MQLADVDSITMTNEVFDDHERALWQADASVGDDPRFEAVLRIDRLLRDWPEAAGQLREWGYDVSEDFSGQHVRGGPPIPARVDRLHEGDLCRGESAAVVPLPVPRTTAPARRSRTPCWKRSFCRPAPKRACRSP